MRKSKYLEFKIPNDKQFDILKFAKVIARKHGVKDHRLNLNVCRDGSEEVFFPLANRWTNFLFFIKRKASTVEVGAELNFKGDTASSAFNEIYYEIESTILLAIQRWQKQSEIV
jgi:hypothetical protein